jgi:hypothetical protein
VLHTPSNASVVIIKLSPQTQGAAAAAVAAAAVAVTVVWDPVFGCVWLKSLTTQARGVMFGHAVQCMFDQATNVAYLIWPHVWQWLHHQVVVAVAEGGVLGVGAVPKPCHLVAFGLACDCSRCLWFRPRV